MRRPCFDGHINTAHLYVHRPVDRVRDVASIRPRKFMRPFYALVLPIGPIQILAEQRQREYVRQLFLDHVVFVIAVQIGERDIIEASVGPVDVICEVVDREGVRPAEVVGDDRSTRAAVHPEAPDVGIVAPVRVEDEAAERVNDKGAGLL